MVTEAIYSVMYFAVQGGVHQVAEPVEGASGRGRGQGQEDKAAGGTEDASHGDRPRAGSDPGTLHHFGDRASWTEGRTQPEGSHDCTAGAGQCWFKCYHGDVIATLGSIILKLSMCEGEG